MLSTSSAGTVRATLPVVGAAIGDITALFYQKMFAAHPDLLRDLFNRGNQAAGTQRQALAGSIAAFATFLLEHPDGRPDDLLARIAHKHASLGVRADQYEIVHRHLFEAIVEVLGEAVTPQVAAAWDEVYWLMANALISLEARLYDGDDQVFSEWTVAGRAQETDEVVTFTVRPVEGAAPAFKPGQFVSVQVRLADGARQIRQYSLTGGDAETLRFSVKRDGEVSTWLHEHAPSGTRLTISRPFGHIVLDETSDRPLVLASAGIGITPMVGMLELLAATGAQQQVLVLHADRNLAAHPHRAHVADLVGKLDKARSVVWYEDPDRGDDALPGRMDLAGVPVPADAVAYLCGPTPFMRGVREQLLRVGVSAADIHYESFGPDLGLS
ncbi:hemin transporter [Catellatospora sp. IY07-71]|uniref:globin domain-containing protein n=1 Tax=Catellatospora sp. IY07-71 TaxID=2728827 RepID=UPI001BB4598B|nr:globin domain-containing protein [Catellatospora sp. IY07-71]BCJ75031.1 hemin transporter [Catellatospora sp. IY07-71]